MSRNSQSQRPMPMVDRSQIISAGDIVVCSGQIREVSHIEHGTGTIFLRETDQFFELCVTKSQVWKATLEEKVDFLIRKALRP